MTNTFSAILSACAGPVALFSDFDGTLVEIAPHPDAIIVPPALKARLAALQTALDGAVAIVTGRPISQIDSLLQLPGLAVSGGHGSEFRLNDINIHASAELGFEAAEMAQLVRSLLGPDNRITLEVKPSGLAVHYRNAPDREADAHEALSAAIAERGEFHIIAGKKVFEARPRGTDKGKATRRFMQHAPFQSRLPIFVGDDNTDEDAFAAVAELGGFGIKVGTGDTVARFRIPDVNAVHALYDALKNKSSATDQSADGEHFHRSAPKEGHSR